MLTKSLEYALTFKFISACLRAPLRSPACFFCLSSFLPIFGVGFWAIWLKMGICHDFTTNFSIWRAFHHLNLVRIFLFGDFDFGAVCWRNLHSRRYWLLVHITALLCCPLDSSIVVVSTRLSNHVQVRSSIEVPSRFRLDRQVG